ncbi:MAG: ferritin family protein [Weeksellaceae bacterium]|nr:ferritin family protein [Weeksellaceae bacterium]
MQAAFEGETNASAKYAEFAKKADEEGYKEIAVLFRAASKAEGIHAENHKQIMLEMGAQPKPVTPAVEVKSTKENLQAAIQGESYEVDKMYPDFMTTADAADAQMALISLNYAYKTEKKHKVLYEKALNALDSKDFSSLAKVYYVCPTCGNTVENQMPKRCDISMTSGDKFLKIV